MSLQPHLSADTFLHLPSKTSTIPTRINNNKNTIIFFIPGNPGLLGYYHEFLSLLATSSSQTSQCTIAGFSLGGFDISPSAPPKDIAEVQYPKDSSPASGSLYGLKDQINLTHGRVRALVETLKQQDQASASTSPATTEGDTNVETAKPYQVILIGHSVGAYIALEVIRRLHVEHSRPHRDEEPSYTILGAILLTPTVIDIAKSRQGRIVMPVLSYVPFVDQLSQWGVWGLVKVLPEVVLGDLVGWVTGMKREGEKLSTTLGWLRSKKGVRQTLSMAGEEMRVIKEDVWGQEVWGASGGEGMRQEQDTGREIPWKAPRLVLYFAREDHWVEDATREAIVKARRRVDAENMKRKASPRVEIEESGKLVHGWCIEQSNEVAAKVREWIEEMSEQ
jgi:pimeloyl-ACP methyl ester carboxylesterase